MRNRPRIRINLSTTDKILEVLGWTVTFSTWGFVAVVYSGLPETIPVHFSISGEPDGFGKKSTIVLLPSIATFLFAGMTFLNRVPHIFNYPVRITEKNAFRQYKNATSMIRWIKLAVVTMFGLIVYHSVRSATGSADGLGNTLLLLSIGSVIILSIYFVVRAVRLK